MDEYGLTAEDYIQDMIVARRKGYLYYSSFALCAYDLLCRLPREIEHIHNNGPWLMIRTIYLSLEVMTFAHILILTHVKIQILVPIQTCHAAMWALGLISHLLLPGVVKLLLVLRLRAIYYSCPRATKILIFAVILELVTGAYQVLLVSITYMKWTDVPNPLHGCHLKVLDEFSKIYTYSPIASWAGRVIGTGIELTLTLIKLFQILRGANNVSGISFWKGLMHLKGVNPIIYVFYRDGTLYLIPIFIVNALGFPEYLHIKNYPLQFIDWGMCLAVVYYLCGTRLILNLREANCKPTQPSIMVQELTSIHFGRLLGKNGSIHNEE